MIVGKKYAILNSKAVKQITKLLQQQWGYDERLGCGFLQKENDIFLTTKDIDKISLQVLNVNSLGLYLGELRHDTLRLSIEGSQIVGKKAKKNVVELNDGQLQQWLKGEDIEFAGKIKNNGSSSGGDCETNAYVIIKHQNDFFGCGRIKDGKLLNFVPKARRMLKLSA